MKKIIIAIGIIILTIPGCKSKEENLKFIDLTEKAHEKQAFLTNEAIQFNLKLAFGGTERMDAKFTLLTNSSKGVIEYKNGTKIIFDENKIFHSAGIQNVESVRFDAYTWSYFFLFPYKASDSGTIWNLYENKEKDHENYLSEKLTFSAGTGDAPDDWYVVYANKETHLIEKAAYIVTYNGSKEEAEKNPHAIQYSDYKEVAGIPIATTWTFWTWKAGEGLKEELGNATISAIKFVAVDQNYFKPGADFVEK
jgi:hypothetical protein